MGVIMNDEIKQDANAHKRVYMKTEKRCDDRLSTVEIVWLKEKEIAARPGSSALGGRILPNTRWTPGRRDA